MAPAITHSSIPGGRFPELPPQGTHRPRGRTEGWARARVKAAQTRLAGHSSPTLHGMPPSRSVKASFPGGAGGLTQVGQTWGDAASARLPPAPPVRVRACPRPQPLLQPKQRPQPGQSPRPHSPTLGLGSAQTLAFSLSRAFCFEAWHGSPTSQPPGPTSKHQDLASLWES